MSCTAPLALVVPGTRYLLLYNDLTHESDDCVLCDEISPHKITARIRVRALCDLIRRSPFCFMHVFRRDTTSEKNESSISVELATLQTETP